MRTKEKIRIVPDMSANFIKEASIEKFRQWSPVFIVNMLAACAVYSLLMCNQLVNTLDGMWHGSVSYANRHELSLGRWLWRFVDKGRLYLSPDPVTSIISLIFFILCTIMILDIFNVKGRFQRYIISLLSTVNISILTALSFRFQSPTFALAMFFGILSAYLLIKAGCLLTVILAAPLSLSFMLGLYQADLGCTALVILLYFSLMLYNNRTTVKKLLLYVAGSLLTIILGFVYYYIILNINLVHYDVELASYNSADSVTLLGALLSFPRSFIHAYVDFFAFFRRSDPLINSNMFSGIVYLPTFILLGLLFSYAFYTLFRKNRWNAILFAASILLVPAACNCVLMVAYSSLTSIQMTLPLSMCIPLLLCLASQISLPEKPAALIYRAALSLLLCVLLYGNYLMTQYDQQAMYMGMKSLKEMSREISGALIKEDLFNPSLHYVFVGNPSDNPLYVKNLVFEKSNAYARVGDWEADDTRTVVQSWQGLWTHEMGINMNVAYDDKVTEVLSDETVSAMPVFPEKGSISFVDDVVVVKVSDF